MAERTVTVKLDPIQVQQLKDFVRDEVAKSKAEHERVAPTSHMVAANKPVIWNSPQDKGGPRQLCVNDARLPQWWPVEEVLPEGWLAVFTR